MYLETNRPVKHIASRSGKTQLYSQARPNRRWPNKRVSAQGAVKEGPCSPLRRAPLRWLAHGILDFMRATRGFLGSLRGGTRYWSSLAGFGLWLLSCALCACAVCGCDKSLANYLLRCRARHRMLVSELQQVFSGTYADKQDQVLVFMLPGAYWREFGGS